MAASSPSEPKKTAKPKRSWSGVFAFFVAVSFFFLYWIRPLPTETITIWPAWVWGVPWLLLYLIRPKKSWRVMRWTLAMWLVTSLTFSEVWRIVLPRSVGETDLKVATLNCGGSMFDAMKELAALEPDIVLIQESSIYIDEKQYVLDAFGPEYEGFFGHDGSVFVRGKILSGDKKSSNFSFVNAELRDGRLVDIVSLRMMAPHARISYWQKDTWDGYTRHRVEHLKELKGIWERVKKLRTGAPLVMGGDFNLVPDKEEPSILGPDLVDSYRVAGRGWYATALTDVALFRIDKIWVSEELKPRGTWSHASEVSDHRYVLGHFDWAK